MANDDGTAARAFHEATKHSFESLHREPHFLDWDNLPTPYKVYKGLPLEPLPAGTDAAGVSVIEAVRASGPARPDEARLDRLAIARLLHFALGVLRRPVGGGRWHEFRAAPCTGALYHVDAYVVTADLGDLAAGVYHYSPRDASLRTLRAGDWRGVLASSSGGEPSVSHAPVIVVLASTYWRNSWKYRRRAYRHVFWDGGTVIAQLLAQAGADGWPANVVLGFADRALEQLCALDPEREGVIALIPVGSGATAPGAAVPPFLSLETEPLSPHEHSYPEIIEAHERGVLDDGRQAAAWRRRGPAPRPAESTSPAIEFGAETAFPAEDLDAVIRRRGSTRAFDHAPIARSALQHLLAAASAAVPADYRRAPDQSLVDLYLVVNAVDDVEPGAYRWDAAGRRLERLWRGERRRDAGILALGQALGADAAVDVYAVADLEAVLAAMGTRGYRAATLDGGIAGGRMYLAAYADRLGATGLTFFDDDVARFFGLDPRRFGVMFLTAVGVPARRRAG
jgi:SagB-type dehydrogenase family enzyme